MSDAAARLVTFAPVNPPGAPVVALLGDGPFSAAAAGGWAFVGRPRRVAFTEWSGEDPYTLTGPILFDGFEDNRPIDQAIESMRRLLRNPVGPRAEPPVLQVRGSAIPQSQRLWVLNAFEQGDVLRRKDGAILRAFFTVTLLEYLPGDVIVAGAKTPAQAAKAKTTTAHSTTARTYTVRKGDTLTSIAAKQLGSAKRAGELGDLNGVRDSRTLKVGQKLRLP